MNFSAIIYRLLRKCSLNLPKVFDFYHDPTMIFSFLSSDRVIYIKIPVPFWSIVKEWGDYYLSVELKKELEKLGYKVIIHCQNQWGNSHVDGCIVLVFRGLYRYSVREYELNLMWNISHPKDIHYDEYQSFDHVFISSLEQVGKLREVLKTKVSLLDQCTNLTKFHPLPFVKKEFDILFVGNSRGVFRKVIKDLLPTDYKFGIIGRGWAEYVHSDYIIKDYVPYEQLNIYYNSTKILLNDHWDDMRESGFVSNRIQDGMAAGCTVVSDKPTGDLSRFFGKNIFFYKSKSHLNETISVILNKEVVSKEVGSDGIHTYSKCAEQIVSVINNLEVIKQNI